MDKEHEKMKKAEVDIKKNYPSLPPNYITIAHLQERWLQRKQQEKEEERQKAQAESKNQDNLNPKKGFSETPQNSYNRDPQIERHHASDHRVYSLLKGKEINGMDKKVNKKETGEGNYKKVMNGVNKGLKGRGKEYEFGKIEGEKDCSRTQPTQGKNRYCNAGFEGAASVFMVKAVQETVSMEIKPVELIRKSYGKTVMDKENLRKPLDWRVKRRGMIPKVEELPENSTTKEDLGVLRENDAPINDGDDDDDCMVVELLENKVKELGSGHNKDSESFGGEVKKNRKKKIKAKKSSDSTDKNTLVEAMEKGMEDEALTGYNKDSESFGGEVKKNRKNKIKAKKSSDSTDKNTLVKAMEKGMEDEALTGYSGNSLQKRRGERKVKEHRRRESVSDVAGTKISGNFRGLSLVDSRKSNMTSSIYIPRGMGYYNKNNRCTMMQKPAENRSVWVKKGEIPATNVAEIDNSGDPIKLEPTGWIDEDR